IRKLLRKGRPSGSAYALLSRLYDDKRRKLDRLKLIEAMVEVEEFGENRTWKSVLVQGTYDELTDKPARHDERLHAWSLLQKQPFWWEP
ncbi:hypothetical protein ACC754_39390, partial [Rhizobium johnstonii]